MPGTTFPAPCQWKLFLTLLWSNPDWILWPNPLFERSALHGLWDAAKLLRKWFLVNLLLSSHERWLHILFASQQEMTHHYACACPCLRLHLSSFNIRNLLNLLYTIPYWKFNVPTKFLNLHYVFSYCIKDINIRQKLMSSIQILSFLVILYHPSDIFKINGNKASPSFKPLNRKLSGEILAYEDSIAVFI
jgi:hypothetical protein